MKAHQLRQKYLNFFIKKGHQVIPSASLIPEEKVDLSGTQKVLFTTAGMHPLIPYLLGETHPRGKCLVNVQKCLRTDDLDQVGDAWHNTFFEMLGNWSLGDSASPDGIGQGGYWKEEAISWSLEFLTDQLNLEKERIFVTIFAGDKGSPKDEETEKIWQKLGISQERIFPLPKSDNWWGPVGESGPCGPDTEMFYDTGKEKCGKECRPGCACGKYAEVWNDVFMEYNKTAEGKYERLKQRNVDTGMGLERTTAILQGKDNVYETELFWPIIQKIGEVSGKSYEDYQKEMRIIADHLKAATFLISESLTPVSKDERGAILRRLIDRANGEGRKLGLDRSFLPAISDPIIDIYQQIYPELNKNRLKIREVLSQVGGRIEQIMTDPTAYKRLENIGSKTEDELKIEEKVYIDKYFGGAISPDELRKKHNLTSWGSIYAGTVAFDVKGTIGYPVSDVQEIAQRSLGQNFKPDEFKKTFEIFYQEHQKKSRMGGEQLFRGGLADQSEAAIKYHTATHLLHQALREVLGSHVKQAGSNITGERLRFDFSHLQKMTEEEIKRVEDLVNQKIKENLLVKMKQMSYEEAIKSGALAFFRERYGGKVKVYSIGNFSKEVCGGPHADFTGKLGVLKIKKEESAAKGVRRIYAILD